MLVPACTATQTATCTDAGVQNMCRTYAGVLCVAGQVRTHAGASLYLDTDSHLRRCRGAEHVQNVCRHVMRSWSGAASAVPACTWTQTATCVETRVAPHRRRCDPTCADMMTACTATQTATCAKTRLTAHRRRCDQTCADSMRSLYLDTDSHLRRCRCDSRTCADIMGSRSAADQMLGQLLCVCREPPEPTPA
jgi:hypothetical protein